MIQKFINIPNKDTKKHSLADIRKFVVEKNKSKNEFLFGIFIEKRNENLHIGNIKLGPINFFIRMRK